MVKSHRDSGHNLQFSVFSSCLKVAHKFKSGTKIPPKHKMSCFSSAVHSAILYQKNTPSSVFYLQMQNLQVILPTLWGEETSFSKKHFSCLTGWHKKGQLMLYMSSEEPWHSSWKVTKNIKYGNSCIGSKIKFIQILTQKAFPMHAKDTHLAAQDTAFFSKYQWSQLL